MYGRERIPSAKLYTNTYAIRPDIWYYSHTVVITTILLTAASHTQWRPANPMYIHPQFCLNYINIQFRTCLILNSNHRVVIYQSHASNIPPHNEWQQATSICDQSNLLKRKCSKAIDCKRTVSMDWTDPVFPTNVQNQSH